MSFFSTPTFDNFIVGDSNKAAFLAAFEAGKSPGRRYNPLFLFGSTGSGKTHLLNAMADAMASGDPSLRICIESYPSFSTRLKDSLETDRSVSFRQEIEEIDAFLLDDVRNDDLWLSFQQELIPWLDLLVQDDKQVAFASNTPLLKLVPLEERFLSRVQRGLIVPLGRPDASVKVRIISLLLEREGLEIDDKSLSFLGELPITDVRELMGIVNRLIVTLNVEGVEISRHWLVRMLRTMVKNGEIRKLKIAVSEEPSKGKIGEVAEEPSVGMEEREGGEEEPPEPTLVETRTIEEEEETAGEMEGVAIATEEEGSSGEAGETVHATRRGEEDFSIDDLGGFIFEWDREEDRLLDEL